MESLSIRPGGPVRGEITVPGDKSISHRAVMFGSLADGVSTVTGFLNGEDSENTARAFEAMGVRIERIDDTTLRVHGVGLDGLKAPQGVLDLGNSGTSMRLMSGILSGQKFPATLDGDASLRGRPMKRVAGPLGLMGADIVGEGDRVLPPLRITPATGGLKGIDYESPIASAQVKSAVLLAGLYADGTTSVNEPAKSRDHTERMLRYMGVEVVEDGLKVSLRGGQRLQAKDIAVPGDISSAAFFMVAAAITPGSDILIKNVGVNPTRTGVIDVLRLMNADIEVEEPRMDGPEPVADIRVRYSQLRGIDIGGELFVRAIDEFPILCIAASCATGVTDITDAAELRVKESDRIAAMAGELDKLGVIVHENPDGLTIDGGCPLRTAEVDSHSDHRVAMSMAVAALAAEVCKDGPKGPGPEEMTINDTACIRTSFPGFNETLESVRD
jgi:3-phosphoshikimate 1-carboxyvinyltransferase